MAPPSDGKLAALLKNLGGAQKNDEGWLLFSGKYMEYQGSGRTGLLLGYLPCTCNEPAGLPYPLGEVPVSQCQGTRGEHGGAGRSMGDAGHVLQLPREIHS